jgi:hypothetical protein
MKTYTSKEAEELADAVDGEGGEVSLRALQATAYQLAALLKSREDAKAVRFIVDWRKGNDPRFVEVETLDGKSCSIPWDETYPGNGLYSMTLFTHPPADSGGAKDAARYRWLRKKRVNPYAVLPIGEALETYIDDAMSADSRESK